jgi:ankyrin repeat protein
MAKLLFKHWGKQVLEETDHYGRGAVHYAAEEGHEEVLHFLLSQGAQANCRDDFDMYTPLMLGAARGKVGTVKMLVQHLGRQVLEEMDGRGQTALFRAAGKEMVAFLLSQGADVHSKDKGGQTPLMFQCRRGGPDTVKLLLKHMGGQGLDAVDDRGDGVLSYAARNRREDLLREEVLRALLLAGAGQGVNLREGLLDAQRVLPINGRCDVLKVLEVRTRGGA